jgi:hypothetical protein
LRECDWKVEYIILKPASEKNLSASVFFVALCGRIFRDTNPQYFPSALHRGRKIEFCTESCLGAFLADPEVFYKVHRNSEKNITDNSFSS